MRELEQHRRPKIDGSQRDELRMLFLPDPDRHGHAFIKLED